jgi:heme/copper-type cytochrome/quinol oxidase subunit 3
MQAGGRSNLFYIVDSFAFVLYFLIGLHGLHLLYGLPVHLQRIVVRNIIVRLTHSYQILVFMSVKVFINILITFRVQISCVFQNR